MLFRNSISSTSFTRWILSDHENKRVLWSSIIIMAISFGWIKYIYPYPNFMPPDSFNYIESAMNNDLINLWPIGYAKFLRLISVFTHSDIFLVTLQYLLLICSIQYFLFTIRYLLSPSKWPFRIIVFITIANPLLPHISNFVSSDCLFTSLSMVWFSQLLWILHKSNGPLIIAHSAIVLLAFITRFTAIYYPIISATVIFFAHMQVKLRLLGIGMITTLILCFIGRTQYEYYIKTGTIQYSAFGGWQVAANALYGYAWVKPDTSTYVPIELRELHNIVNKHMDSIRKLSYRPDSIPGIYYFWDLKSPLRLYLNKISSKKQNIFFEQWATVAPLYYKYGRWLTMKYPTSYIKHYILPNLIRYYSPPPNFMGSYNLGSKLVNPIAATWFNWKSNLISNRINRGTIHIMSIFPTLLAIINPAYMFCFLFFTFHSGYRLYNKTGKQIILCTFLIWFCNTIFSVLSAPIELRYQIFPTIITVSFLILFVCSLIESLKKDSPVNGKHIIPDIIQW
jgi:hypothetical protein